MKVEWRTAIGASILLGIIAAVYWVLVYFHGNASEYAGVTMLVFSFGAYAIMGVFLWMQYMRRHGKPRPEDRFDATQADGAGDIAYFPTASIWPAGLAVGVVISAASLVWGLWYLVIGMPIFLGAIIGWVVESDYTQYEDEVVPKVFTRD